MRKCVICGSDTILCVSGEPICIACDDRLQGEPLKKVSEQREPQSGESGNPHEQKVTGQQRAGPHAP
jgi:hypothetical protein